jgi:hypothetical protein
MHALMGDATHGEGHAVSNLENIGDGPGFLKVRRELGGLPGA